MMGSNVKGGQILGKYPDLEGNYVEKRGRFIPTTSWDAIWHGIASWMGVPGEKLLDVVPGREEEIANGEFFNGNDLFTDATQPPITPPSTQTSSTPTPSPTLPITPSPTVAPTPSPTLPITPSPTFAPTPSPTLPITPSPTVGPTVKVTLQPTESCSKKNEYCETNADCCKKKCKKKKKQCRK